MPTMLLQDNVCILVSAAEGKKCDAVCNIAIAFSVNAKIADCTKPKNAWIDARLKC